MTTPLSVAEALGRAHGTLLGDVDKLEAAAQSTAPGSLGDLRARLGVTLIHVTDHFRFEEEDGYMDAVTKRRPNLEPTVHHLAEEHGQLFRFLKSLIEQARAAGKLDDQLRDEVREWIRHLREHEIRETDLVQEAFNQDFDAED